MWSLRAKHRNIPCWNAEEVKIIQFSFAEESKSSPSKKPPGEGEVPPIPEGQTERVEKPVEGAESDGNSTREYCPLLKSH